MARPRCRAVGQHLADLPVLLPGLHGRPAGAARATRSRRRRSTAPASPRVLRSIILPLVLVATAPLLISSFAFSFNNFTIIYLFNNGGPAIPGAPVRARLHRHPDLGDLRHLRRLGRRGRLRPRQRAVDPRVHRRRPHLGAGVPPDPQARGVHVMSATAATHRRRPPAPDTPPPTSRATRPPPPLAARRRLEVPARASSSSSTRCSRSSTCSRHRSIRAGSLAASNAHLQRRRLRELRRARRHQLLDLGGQHAADRRHRRRRRGAHGRRRRLRVLALPLLGPPGEPHRRCSSSRCSRRRSRSSRSS